MQRRIEAGVDFRADQAGLAFAPVRAGNHLLGRHQNEIQPVPLQEQYELDAADGIEKQHTIPCGSYLRRASRCIAMVTRSRAICPRRISASCSFASNTFSSKL